ncbi:universal stress protein [Candidatus Bathyarchaeota archaeon]|nr:MAG: universal stress protein [Candidatus Bathyarchaeota archaeon]
MIRNIVGESKLQSDNWQPWDDYGIKFYENTEEELTRQLIKKILVPVDGSLNSDHALEFAIDLAKKYSAEVYLLYTISLTLIYSLTLGLWEPFSSPLPPSYRVELEDEGEEILASALNKVKKAGIKSVAWLDYGRPASKIIQTAKEERIDLIVMKGENHSLITRLFFGSISDEVSRHAPCPVLIVKSRRRRNKTKKEGTSHES